MEKMCRCYEFEMTIPQKSLVRIQVWDWDLASSNDKIAETSIDIENRWFSLHRATCGLPKRYDRFFITFLLDSLFLFIEYLVLDTMHGEIRRNQGLFSMNCADYRN